MAKFIVKIVFALTLLTISFNVQGQETDTDSTGYSGVRPYHIILSNGTTYSGFILEDNGREILLNTTTVGKIYILKTNIKSISEIDDIGKLKQGKYIGYEKFYTRTLVAPTAFSLEKGENIAVMPYLTYAHASYGVTDKFDIGFGTSWLLNPISGSIKYTLNLGDKMKFAVGGLGYTTTYSFGGGNNRGAFGFAVLSYGRPSSNISFAAGYGLMSDTGFTQEGYAVSVSGYKRFKPRWSVIGEAVYLPELFIYFAGPGIRYTRKRNENECIDFGVLLIGSDRINGGNPVSGFPVLTYTVIL